MIREYIQSEEMYKGFKLVMRRYCLDDNRGVYHRQCKVYKGDECIGISKTKKEAKDLIDGGYLHG